MQLKLHHLFLLLEKPPLLPQCLLLLLLQEVPHLLLPNLLLLQEVAMASLPLQEKSQLLLQETHQNSSRLQSFINVTRWYEEGNRVRRYFQALRMLRHTTKVIMGYYYDYYYGQTLHIDTDKNLYIL